MPRKQSGNPGAAVGRAHRAPWLRVSCTLPWNPALAEHCLHTEPAPCLPYLYSARLISPHTSTHLFPHTSPHIPPPCISLLTHHPTAVQELIYTDKAEIAAINLMLRSREAGGFGTHHIMPAARSADELGRKVARRERMQQVRPSLV